MEGRANSFTIRLADAVIRVHPLFSQAETLCRDYLTQDAPDFEVTITEADIQAERRYARRTARAEQRKSAVYPDSYLETLATYRKIAVQMLNYDTVLFHGSAVALDGACYLFTAPSGTGKSTHTRLWREYFGERAWMVNDDKPLLRRTDKGILVWGTPWDGKHHLSRNAAVPLKAVCLLERDETNHIRPMSRREAFEVCMRQCYLPEEREQMGQTLALMDGLLRSVPFYRLGCNMEPDAARVAYEGMR